MYLFLHRVVYTLFIASSCVYLILHRVVPYTASSCMYLFFAASCMYISKYSLILHRVIHVYLAPFCVSSCPFFCPFFSRSACEWWGVGVLLRYSTILQLRSPSLVETFPRTPALPRGCATDQKTIVRSNRLPLLALWRGGGVRHVVGLP